MSLYDELLDTGYSRPEPPSSWASTAYYTCEKQGYVLLQTKCLLGNSWHTQSFFDMARMPHTLRVRLSMGTNLPSLCMQTPLIIPSPTILTTVTTFLSSSITHPYLPRHKTDCLDSPPPCPLPILQDDLSPSPHQSERLCQSLMYNPSSRMAYFTVLCWLSGTKTH